MAQPIVYVDTSAIRHGRSAELRRAMEHLAGFVQTHVPRLISYGFYVDDQESEMRVVAVHPDSDSLVFHLKVGGSEFRKFVDLIELKKIEVYGPIGDNVLELLHQKARMLGSDTVAVYRFCAGFAR